ncbi:MAG: O-antigen ligase [Flavobacterium sp.]|jgi:O-antigen ligase
MGNIYNFLKNVLTDIQSENKENISFIFLALLITSIPLSLGLNNFFLILFLGSILLLLKKKSFVFSKELFLPILLYALMLFSYFWSIDKTLTLKALPKEVVLLLIPIAFMVLQPITDKYKSKVIKYYSYSIVLVVVYFLIRAIIRFFVFKDTSVFFYHGEYNNDIGLVPKELNAIHASVFIVIAFFYFYTLLENNIINKIISVLLFTFIVLLSSKNIILVFILLIFIHFFFFSKSANKMRLRNIFLFLIIIGFVFSFGKIKERFQLEFQTNSNKSLSSNVIKGLPEGVHNISIKEAWSNEKFTPNDFFPGTAFRIYQARLFFEFLQEENIFWTGFGLNASYKKLEEKAVYYNVFQGTDKIEGYQKKNFHNQYFQVFAEVGIFGFLILALILYINLKKAINNKDFIHIAFAILMISLFLTESFLWRQRGVVFFTLFYCLFNSTKKE